MELERVRLRNVIGPTSGGTAVILGNEKKNFVMYVGVFEGAAILRELNSEEPPRPLTHELIGYLLTGFGIKVKQIIISDIVDNTFCATLVLEQTINGSDDDDDTKRNEVRIDARPSDCIVIALKTKSDIFVTRGVMEKVKDISEEISAIQQKDIKPGPDEFKLGDLGLDLELDLGEKEDEEDEDDPKEDFL
ncbi:MAG: bifunctional nuclease family protein [Planctomycetota bacterium]|nr:bifunctional nuclease family protein [Planctomycetota bacterium]